MARRCGPRRRWALTSLAASTDLSPSLPAVPWPPATIPHNPRNPSLAASRSVTTWALRRPRRDSRDCGGGQHCRTQNPSLPAGAQGERWPGRLASQDTFFQIAGKWSVPAWGVFLTACACLRSVRCRAEAAASLLCRGIPARNRFWISGESAHAQSATGLALRSGKWPPAPLLFLRTRLSVEKL
jgi:hypothetical protein